jgi:GGDEF domain-containing protein
MEPSVDAVPTPVEGGAPAETLIVCRLELDHLDGLDPALAATLSKEVERRLNSLAGDADRVTRRGEGFLFSVQSTPLAEAEALAGRLLDLVGLQPFDVGLGQYLRRSASIGWAPFPWQAAHDDGPDRARVLQLAERALYMAQRSGLNQAIGILPMDDDRCGASVQLVRVMGPDLIADEPTIPMAAGGG